LTEEKRKAVIDHTLLKQMGTVQDIAQAILFLAKCEYITGQELLIDGGLLK
jgi:NAD(P)-dependent dehydrogenase (short-subunit alcohol dehydrogenase family)